LTKGCQAGELVEHPRKDVLSGEQRRVVGELGRHHALRRPGAVEVALRWASSIEAEFDRDITEAKLLTISAMVSEDLCRLGEARETLLAVLSRGEALDERRLQLVAIDNLANVAGSLGRWDERAEWGRRMLDLAESIGAVPQRAAAQYQPGCCSPGPGRPGDNAAAQRTGAGQRPSGRRSTDGVGRDANAWRDALLER
jgi:hypothetical protein